MDYFRLDSSDFKELFFDMQDLRQAFKNRDRVFQSDFNVGKLGLGEYDLVTERKGNIYLTKQKSSFNKNIIAQSKEGIQNVGLYFRRAGKAAYELDTNDRVLQSFPANTNGIFFMHEENSGREFRAKDDSLESTSLHFSLTYFKQLANLYPELFEKAFLRYEKGESFYLKEQFDTTTSEMYHILSQIENSHLFGNGEEAYIDAKTLELLVLQFQNTETDWQKTVCKSFRDYDKIREAHFILLSNIHTPPSVRELALQVGINEKKLKCGFKEVFSNTVYGYLFDYKMQLAEQLLKDTNKSIAEVALQCGYNYPSHFCTAFKRKFGVTPHKARK